MCFLTANINSPKLLTSKEEFCFYPGDLVSLRLLVCLHLFLECDRGLSLPSLPNVSEL